MTLGEIVTSQYNRMIMTLGEIVTSQYNPMIMIYSWGTDHFRLLFGTSRFQKRDNVQSSGFCWPLYKRHGFVHGDSRCSEWGRLWLFYASMMVPVRRSSSTSPRCCVSLSRNAGEFSCRLTCSGQCRIQDVTLRGRELCQRGGGLKIIKV